MNPLKILIYMEKYIGIWDQLRLQLDRQKIPFVLVHDKEKLIYNLYHQNYSNILFFLDDELTPEVENTMVEYGRFHKDHVHKWVFVYERLNSFELEKLLRHQFYNIFENPLNEQLIIESFTHSIDEGEQLSEDISVSGLQEKNTKKGSEELANKVFSKHGVEWMPDPIDCDVKVFCKLNKLHNSPFGDAKIEAPVKLQVGDKLTLGTDMYKEFGGISDFKVFNLYTKNLYYGYGYSYWLEWCADNKQRARFKDKLESIKDRFVFPKIKVIWISENFQMSYKKFFERKAFSLHYIHPERLTREKIDHISAPIILVNTEKKYVERIVGEYHKKNTQTLILRTHKSQRANWLHIDLKDEMDFYNRFVEISRPYIKQIILDMGLSGHFLDKRDKYSSIHIKLKGILKGVGTLSLVLLTPQQLEVGTLINIQISPLKKEDKKSPQNTLYGVVKFVHKNINFSLIRILPINIQQNSFMANNLKIRGRDFESMNDFEVFIDNMMEEKKKKDEMANEFALDKINNYIMIVVSFVVLTFLYLFFMPDKKKTTRKHNSMKMDQTLKYLKKSFDR